MGIMPYHLEKGHYLLLLEETLNEGIEAVVDDDTATTFPGLDRRYSMLEHMRDVVARPCDLTHGESETGGLLAWPEFMDDDAVGFRISRIIAKNWFGYRIRNDGTARYQAAPEQADRHVGWLPGQCRADHCQHAGSCHRGLTRARPRRGHPDRLATAKLAHLLLLQVSATILRGLGHVAMSQRQSTRGRAGHGDVRDTRSQPPGLRPPDPDRHRRRPQGRFRSDLAQRRRVPRGAGHGVRRRILPAIRTKGCGS